MNYVGIDLHRKQMVFSVENEQGPVGKPVRVDCHSVLLIESMFRKLAPFRAVIESSTSYRWLYDLLSPLGECILAHPLKLRAIVSGRAKTDKLDSAMLAKLLRADLIPRSYVPEENYQFLRDVTRARARLVRQATHAKNELHAMMTRCNVRSPYSNALCKRGRQWIAMQDLGYGSDFAKHELLRRIEYYEREVTEMDLQLAGIAHAYPQAEALTDLYGVGLYTALLVVGELGAPERFFSGDKVGAYTGLTAEVRQSGGHEYRGNISRQGSAWLRWVLVQAAMKLVRRDEKLKNFYSRIRRRSGVKVARVAAARKLAEICWVRLRRWHREHPRTAA